MSGAQQPAERTFSAKNVIVIQTFVVQSRDGGYHYEVHLAPDAEPGAQRTVVITRNEQAYDFALHLESNGAKVNASWHHARRGSQRVAVLDTLEAPAS